MLPIYKLPRKDANLNGLVKHVHKFVEHKKYDNITLAGNSLGGHIALLYALEHQERLKALVLTGSSGLYENTFGDTYPKRSDYNYIKEKTELTFYDPKTATKELVDEVFELTKDREKAIKIIGMSKAAINNNLADELHKIKVPVSLIWGKNDIVTPPHVAEEFKKLIPNAELQFIDKCGHAPMMEKPDEFNVILEQFLVDLSKQNVT